MIYQGIDELVGKTPLVRIHHVTKGIGAEVLVKLERNNPAGSIKDRVALQMILDAEEEGKITARSGDHRTYQRQHRRGTCGIWGRSRIPGDLDHAGDDEPGTTDAADSLWSASGVDAGQRGNAGSN